MLKAVRCCKYGTCGDDGILHYGVLCEVIRTMGAILQKRAAGRGRRWTVQPGAARLLAVPDGAGGAGACRACLMGTAGGRGEKKSRQARINACARLVNVVAYSRGRACRAAAFFAGLTPRRIVSLGGAFLV